MGTSVGSNGLASSNAQSGVPNLDVSSSSGATVTVGANNDYYKADAASNAQVFILPNPSTNKGKQITVEKVDTTLNVVTLNDGSNVTTLNTNGEAVTVVADGASYQIINRRIPSVWNTNLTFTPDATAFGTVTGATFLSRRNGDSLEVKGYFINGTATANPSMFALPAGVTIASTKIVAGQRNEVGSYYCVNGPAGGGSAIFNNLGGRSLGPVLANSASLAVVGFANAGFSLLASIQNANQIFSDGEGVIFNFSIPVTGWNG